MWGEANVHLIPYDRIDHYVTPECWCSPVTTQGYCCHRNMGSFESPYLAVDFSPYEEYSTGQGDIRPPRVV